MKNLKKSIITAILILATALLCSIFASAEMVLGDTNGDLSVTTDDAILLLRNSLAPQKYPTVGTSDFNGDNAPNSDDAIYLLRHILDKQNYPLSANPNDITIIANADTYVLNKDGNGDQTGTNYGTEKEIVIKSSANSLTRYGYVKFDISELAKNSNFTDVDLNLSIISRELKSNPYYTVNIFGVDPNWDESAVTFNNFPECYNHVCSNSKIMKNTQVACFSVTDYVKQALEKGENEVAFYIVEESADTPRRITFASREAGEADAPRLSVYYGTKRDNTEYSAIPELSENGLDRILGATECDNKIISVSEDAYVQGGSVDTQNFGGEDILILKDQSKDSNRRYTLIKFDISSLLGDSFNKARLVLINTGEMENMTVTRTLEIYECAPDAWEEMTVTYKTAPQRGKLITKHTIYGKYNLSIDITDYVKACAKSGKSEISLFLAQNADAPYRSNYYSKESGKGPKLEIQYNLAFDTLLYYKDENPWQVAMDAVTEWLDRADEIYAHGRNDAELIVKDPDEYSIIVDATTAGKTDGYNTMYSQYATRNISTLKGYKASTAETALYDVYGGYTGGERYEATGYFYTKKIGDRWWNIDPLGYPFYRTAIVQISHGTSAKQQEATLAKYGTKSAWATAANQRAFELGFNSAGGWSDIESLSQATDPVSQTQIFNVATQYGSSIGRKVSSGGTRLPEADVIPVFDPGFAVFADNRIKNLVSPYANDPSVYGWMSDNELADNLDMLDHALALNSKDRLRDFTYATAWTFMYLKTGQKNVSTADITNELREEFLAMTYDKYFQVVTTALDKYDPNHMYMGCRFVNNNYKRESVMRVAGYWCDVVTFNYYGAWEGDPTLLANIQNWLGDTPFVVTEFYAKGMDVWEADNSMLNKTGAGWTVKTQEDRGKFYQNYALMLMECKGCVGFDWFKYWDNDPTNEKADPSNIDSNKGIISNSLTEYTDLTEKYMKPLNYQKYNLINFFDAR